MTISGMARRPRRLRSCLLVLGLVLPCLVWLVPLSFVQGRAWDGNRAAKRQATIRLGQRLQGRPPRADGQAKRLTSRIKTATSAQKLLGMLDEAVDGPIFDFIHASAAYTQLVSFKRSRALGQRDWESPGLLRLHTRVEDMILQDQLGARPTANVLWSIAQLFDQFSIPTQLLAALVKSLPTEVNGMKPQELANCLWASAQLKDIAPDVLKAVPAIVDQIPGKAQDMKPQELSNSLWASAQLKDVAPDVLEVVPALVAQIPNRAKDMIPQQLSNCLWASAKLKDEVPKVVEIVPAIVGEISLKISDMKAQELSNSVEALVLLRDSVPEVAAFLAAGGSMNDILRSSAARLNTLLPSLKGKDLSFTVPVVVWACAKAEVCHGELLDSVARRLGSQRELSALPDFGVCALSWSYQVLDTGNDFKDFKHLLMSEATSPERRLSGADVLSCELGRFQWNRS